MIVPGSKAGNDQVLPQVWSFGDRRRAERLARQVRGARVSGPRRGGCLRAFAVLVAVAILLLGVLVVLGGMGVSR